MAKKTKIVVLAVIPSDTDPNEHYEVRIGHDGNVYCTCPAWRFQHRAPGERTCKHLQGLAKKLGPHATNDPAPASGSGTPSTPSTPVF